MLALCCIVSDLTSFKNHFHFIEELDHERKVREKMETQLKVLQEELNEVKSQVTITELNKDSEIEDLKQRGEQEIATLHRLYEGKVYSDFCFLMI